MRRWFSVGFAVCFLINSGCSVNILSTFANTTSNEALFEDAQTAVNTGDYNAALTKIGLMTGAFATSERVQVLKASAYGGLCGFNFPNFALALSGMGSTLLFTFLLQQFDYASATNVTNCINAQHAIEAIGTVSQRTTDQNIFLAMIAFAKVGNILSLYWDAGRTGSPTLSIDACSAVNLPDGDARELGTGITIALENLNAVAGKISLGGTQMSSISGVCTWLATNLPAYDFCGTTDPAAFSANEIKGIRSLIKENSVMGLSLTAGAGCPGDVSTCNCP